MKKLFPLFLICSIFFAMYSCSGPVSAAPGLTAQNSVPVQAIVPKAAKSTCVTINKARAGYATVDVSGTNAISWDARVDNTTTAAGTAEPLKVYYNSNTAYMPNAGSRTDLKIDRSTTTVKFERYSSGKAATFCYELN